MNKVKIEDIKALIPDLTDENVNKLQQLFDRNFLNIVTGFENDIYDITRINKTGTEKYHEYLKRAFGDYILANTDKEKITGLENQIASLGKEKKDLEDKLKLGITGKTKEDLDKLEATLKLKDDKITELQGQMKKAQDMFDEEKGKILQTSSLTMKSLMIGQVRDKYKIDNAAIPEPLREVIYRDIETKLNDFEIRVENKIPLLYKDNQLQYSVKNPLEVLSLDNYYKEQLEPYGIKSVTGIPGQTGTQGTGVIAGARTKAEAHIMITKHLESKGIDKNSESYNTEFTKVAKETGAFDLPME